MRWKYGQAKLESSKAKDMKELSGRRKKPNTNEYEMRAGQNGRSKKRRKRRMVRRVSGSPKNEEKKEKPKEEISEKQVYRVY